MNARTRSRNWIWAAAAAAAVVAVGTAGVARSRPAREPPRYETAQLDRGPVVARVTASGTVSARRTVLVSSQVSGRVKELRADFNTPVHRGELLARIDPQPFEAAVAQSEANAAVARANVEKARAKAADVERQAARKKILADRKLIAPEEWETAEADVATARAEVAAAEGTVAQTRAALEQARFNLAMTAIRAPVDGIVVSRDVDVGQTVAASLQAPTLFTIAEDLRVMQVQAHVSESDVGRVLEGMSATFTVDAWPRERMQGTVRQVRNAAQTVQNVVTYDVVVDVENPDLRLRPGMTANVTFVVAERRDALRVPNAALRFRPPGAAAGDGAGAAPEGPDGRVLHALEGGALRVVPVRVGVSDGSFTEIVSGPVQAGTVVATRAADAAEPSGPAASGGSTGNGSRRRGAGGPPRMF